MINSKAILLRILDIIGHSDNKDKFATEFLQNVSIQALLDLFNTLPQEKKDQLQQKIASIENNATKMQEELKTSFTDSQIEQAIETSAKNAVKEYIKTIEDTLSDSQKQNLSNYFNELTKNTTSAMV